MVITKKEQLINEEIKCPKVRVTDSDGNQLGILETKEALRIAFEKDLDLVLIAPKAEPPVCKIMDYGKFCYEKTKKEKEAKKNQKVTALKEVQLSYKIDTHDFETKLNRAIKFLERGDKVKVVMRFKNREISHATLGTEILERFSIGCEEVGAVDKPAKLEGRSMIMIISPKSSKSVK